MVNTIIVEAITMTGNIHSCTKYGNGIHRVVCFFLSSQLFSYWIWSISQIFPWIIWMLDLWKKLDRQKFWLCRTIQNRFESVGSMDTIQQKEFGNYLKHSFQHICSVMNHNDNWLKCVMHTIRIYGVDNYSSDWISTCRF